MTVASERLVKGPPEVCYLHSVEISSKALSSIVLCSMAHQHANTTRRGETLRRAFSVWLSDNVV
jgi:hypothetical protein